MKKLIPVLFLFLAACAIFQACDSNKTYAEQQKEERTAIASFIKDSTINVISFEQFQRQDSTTDISKNEYVQLQEGIYMQIIDKGTGDTIPDRGEVLVRFMEYSIADRYIMGSSNFNNSTWVDSFIYTESGTSVSGQFNESWLYYWYVNTVGYTSMTFAVPSGWLIPLKYVTNYSHVKIIVPHKFGHAYSRQYVMPFYYEIYKYQLWG